MCVGFELKRIFVRGFVNLKLKILFHEQYVKYLIVYHFGLEFVYKPKFVKYMYILYVELNQFGSADSEIVAKKQANEN